MCGAACGDSAKCCTTLTYVTIVMIGTLIEIVSSHAHRCQIYCIRSMLHGEASIQCIQHVRHRVAPSLPTRELPYHSIADARQLCNDWPRHEPTPNMHLWGKVRTESRRHQKKSVVIAIRKQLSETYGLKRVPAEAAQCITAGQQQGCAAMGAHILGGGVIPITDALYTRPSSLRGTHSHRPRHQSCRGGACKGISAPWLLLSEKGRTLSTAVGRSANKEEHHHEEGLEVEKRTLRAKLASRQQRGHAVCT